MDAYFLRSLLFNFLDSVLTRPDTLLLIIN